MPFIPSQPPNTISRDSLAGYDNESSVSVQSAVRGSAPTSADVAKQSNAWKKLYDVLPRFIRNVRAWVMDEQLTVYAGTVDLATDSAVALLAYNVATWINLLGTFNPATSVIAYPVANSHLKHNGLFSIFRAPQAGDYLIHFFLLANSSDTENTNFVELLLSTRESSNGAWRTPLVIAGDTNTAISLTTIICANGCAIIRLPRGGQIRFGLTQIGSSATHATITAAEARVIITKPKFYPQLIT